MRNFALIIGIIIGFAFGTFFTGLTFKLAAPHLLFKEIESPYSFDKTVEIIVNRINQQPGWHIVSIINQREEVLKHGGPDIGPMKIIKFCNADLSGRMLIADDRKFFGVKVPASIAVYEKSNGKVYISVMNSKVMSKLFTGTIQDVIEDVIRDAEQILNFVHFRYTIF